MSNNFVQLHVYIVEWMLFYEPCLQILIVGLPFCNAVYHLLLQGGL